MSKVKNFTNIRTDNEKNLDQYRNEWKKVADARLSREQAGDSFNPWLTMKQAYYDLKARIPEAYLTNTDPFVGNPMTDQRNQAFEKSLEEIRNPPKLPIKKPAP